MPYLADGGFRSIDAYGPLGVSEGKVKAPSISVSIAIVTDLYSKFMTSFWFQLTPLRLKILIIALEIA